MWSIKEFSQGLSDFHPMNKDSMHRAAFAVEQNAGQSFSRSLGNSFRQTVAGIFSKEKMTTELMLEGHIQATIDRCKSSAGDCIIIAQDSTYYNYNGHEKMDGLGLIQKGTRGIVQHNALAMDGQGIPLGLVYQRNWTRKGANAFELESDKWTEGLKHTNENLDRINKSVVLVQDREADIFDFLRSPRADNVDLIVRVFKNRKLQTIEEGKTINLSDKIKQLPELGTHQVTIRRSNREVALTLSIKSSRISILPPNKQVKSGITEPVELNLVVAREIEAVDKKGADCFNEKQAACWILLTTLEVKALDQACLIVKYYAMRWLVERFHFTLKSASLKVEKLQFDDVLTTFNALAFYSIVAWRILFLTLSVRQDSEQSPEQYFDPLEMKILTSKNKNANQSLGHAIKALGEFVNFVPTTKQPYPGIKVMSEAITKLATITEALRNIYDDPLQD